MVILVAAWLHGAAPAEAQGRGITITPTAGWQWGGTLDYYDPYSGTGGDVHINAAQTYGGTISVPVRPGYSGEISYWYQGSEVVARPERAPRYKLFDLGTHYIQLSGIRDLGYEERQVVPYLVGGLGTVILDPGSSPYGDFGSRWQFALHAGGGVRVEMSEKVSLRLQGRLLMPTRWVSGGAWFGTGGSGLGLTTSVVPQGDAYLGLSFKLGS